MPREKNEQWENEWVQNGPEWNEWVQNITKNRDLPLKTYFCFNPNSRYVYAERWQIQNFWYFFRKNFFLYFFFKINFWYSKNQFVKIKNYIFFWKQFFFILAWKNYYPFTNNQLFLKMNILYIYIYIYIYIYTNLQRFNEIKKSIKSINLITN